ncbi:MAG: DNA-formamidopyrimidine glycosylase family protein [Dehalococcoidia bacterium]
MPEIPDLEAVREILNRHLAGVRIESVEAPKPIVVRLPVDDFRARLTGATFGRIDRRGKFLLFTLSTHDVLLVNAMLTGRFQYTEPSRERSARTCFVLSLADGCELRYVDQRFMGKVYLVAADALESVPQFGTMGPDALDPELSEEVFLQRLRRYRGQVKNVLVKAEFIAGIGNAYADEILFDAGIHPFTKVSDLADPQRREIYQALQRVMDWAIPIVREEMDGDPAAKPRDFLRVHRKGGQDCPRCGTSISEVSPNRRVTSFCRKCQPGYARGSRRG